MAREPSLCTGRGLSPGKKVGPRELMAINAEGPFPDLTLGGVREKLLPEEAAGGHPEDIGILLDADALLGSEP